LENFVLFLTTAMLAVNIDRDRRRAGFA
jgi:hypothetical protein